MKVPIWYAFIFPVAFTIVVIGLNKMCIKDCININCMNISDCGGMLVSQSIKMDLIFMITGIRKSISNRNEYFALLKTSSWHRVKSCSA